MSDVNYSQSLGSIARALHELTPQFERMIGKLETIGEPLERATTALERIADSIERIANTVGALTSGTEDVSLHVQAHVDGIVDTRDASS